MSKYYKYKILIIFFSYFFISPSYSENNNQIKNNFLILLEKEFLNKKVKTKSNLDKKNFSILDLKKNEYDVSFNILKKKY